MAKEVNGEREEYLLLGQEVLKTFDRSGNVKVDYFLGLGREGMKTNGTWKYYLTDGLGSTALLTDSSGNTVAAYDCEDYGATTQIAGVYNHCASPEVVLLCQSLSLGRRILPQSSSFGRGRLEG